MSGTINCNLLAVCQHHVAFRIRQVQMSLLLAVLWSCVVDIYCPRAPYIVLQPTFTVRPPLSCISPIPLGVRRCVYFRTKRYRLPCQSPVGVWCCLSGILSYSYAKTTLSVGCHFNLLQVYLDKTII